MRRSASPSKGSGARSAFKPLTIPPRVDVPSVGAADSHTASTESAHTSRQKSVQELKDEVAQLESSIAGNLARHNEHQKTLGKSEQDPTAIVQTYIRLLTEYNQVKDSAQVLFDKIADIEQISSRTVHERYGLSESD